MTDRRGSRFVLEVLFLLALTVALTLANLRPIEIAGIMLIGWVIVAVLEWLAWREEPHYGSGLPPRYYVPQVNLPPAQPLEPVSVGYPEARDEAPTWIASPALRAEMLGTEPLGDWPVAEPPVSPRGEAEPDGDPWTTAEELPAAPLGELVAEPAPVPEPEPEPAFIPPPLSPPPIPAAAVATAPPVLEAEAEPEPEPQPEPEPEPERRPEPEPVPDPEPELMPDREPEPVPEPSLEVELVRSVQGVARYSLEPLADPQPRRRFGRGDRTEPAAVEVPARPEGARALPGRTKRQD
jgi:hypothetical protein